MTKIDNDPAFSDSEQIPFALNVSDRSTDSSLTVDSEAPVGGEEEIEIDPFGTIVEESRSEAAPAVDVAVAAFVEAGAGDELSMGPAEYIDAQPAVAGLEIQESVSEEQPAVKVSASSVSLPAALCDDLLLSELAEIPSKMGFKIGEVADMLGIKQYVLRYWETEFDVLKPKKAANNQRYYTRKDVENVFLIRKLLHRDRFSIEGARTALRELKTVVRKEKDWSQVNQRVEILGERLSYLIGDIGRLKRLFQGHSAGSSIEA